MRPTKANPAVVIMGRLLYQMRVEDAKRFKARRRKSYRQTRRDHARVSLARW